MPWRRSEHLKAPPSPLPVPDAETVRRAALVASWRRDRRVAKRRLAWRWLLWYAGRYHLQIVGVILALLLAAWLARNAWISDSPEQAANTVIENAGATHRPQAAKPKQPLPAWPAQSLIPAAVYDDLPMADLSALSLRLMHQLSQKPTPDVQPDTAHPIESAVESANLSLITESWLHSKEP